MACFYGSTPAIRTTFIAPADSAINSCFCPPAAACGRLEPIAEMLLINRARENPKPVRPGTLAVVNKKQPNGYRLDIRIPEAALTGFDPAEHPRLGFHWAVIDREIGELTFCCPPGLPYREDPSVWGTLELIR